MSGNQVRWAALGAAVAVSLGGGGLGIAHAVIDTGAKPVFVPITPCRIVDSRSYGGFTVGPRSTPIGPGETYEVHAAGGVNGQCDNIPATAVGLVMNVTIADPSDNTFVVIWPSDAARPNASNLNALAGKTEPTPNLVTTDLSANGTFSIYNVAGTVNVIADVAGYYSDHNHDDRYYTKTQSDTNFLTESEGDALYVNEADVAASSRFHSGDGPPAPSIGSDGDMYFDRTGRTLYGPRSLSDWGTGTPLGGGSIVGQSRSGTLPAMTLLTPTIVPLDSLVTSFGSGITYNNAADQFTVASAGVYRISYNANVTASLLGTTFQVRVDGMPQGSAVSTAAINESLSDSMLLALADGDVVDLTVGGIINLGLAGTATFTVERVT